MSTPTISTHPTKSTTTFHVYHDLSVMTVFLSSVLALLHWRWGFFLTGYLDNTPELAIFYEEDCG